MLQQYSESRFQVLSTPPCSLGRQDRLLHRHHSLLLVETINRAEAPAVAYNTLQTYNRMDIITAVDGAEPFGMKRKKRRQMHSTGTKHMRAHHELIWTLWKEGNSL